MTCERNARRVLAYLESEETVLRSVKKNLDNLVMQLQLDEMSLLIVYSNIKQRKIIEAQKRVEVKKEPGIKTEPLSPEKMITFDTDVLDVKPFDLVPPADLQLYDHLKEHFDSEVEDENQDISLEPLYSYPKSII